MQGSSAKCQFKHNHSRYEVVFHSPDRVQIFFIAPDRLDNMPDEMRDLVMETTWDWKMKTIRESEWGELRRNIHLHKPTFMVQATMVLRKMISRPLQTCCQTIPK